MLHRIFPVALLTIGALRDGWKIYMRTARVMRLSACQTATSVLLAAILPELVTGPRSELSSILPGMLIAEILASDQCVGSLLIQAPGANRIAYVMALAFLIFAFGAGLAWILLAIEHRAHHVLDARSVVSGTLAWVDGGRQRRLRA